MISLWNADRTMYGSTIQPDGFERALLEAYAKLHWLKIVTNQNFKAIRKAHDHETE